MISEKSLKGKKELLENLSVHTCDGDSAACAVNIAAVTDVSTAGLMDTTGTPVHFTCLLCRQQFHTISNGNLYGHFAKHDRGEITKGQCASSCEVFRDDVVPARQ
eukprot:PhM_4_TR13896/c0_g2_i2/m.5458